MSKLPTLHHHSTENQLPAYIRSMSLGSQTTSHDYAQSSPRLSSRPSRSAQKRTRFAHLVRNDAPPLPSSFADIIRHQSSNPGQFDAPNSLLSSSTSSSGVGSLRSSHRRSSSDTKVKVILCVQQHNAPGQDALLPVSCGAAHRVSQSISPSPPGSCISIDQRHSQVTITDPDPPRRRIGQPPVRIFSFDSIHVRQKNTQQFCTAALSHALRAVLNGQDSCVLALGHKRTGKTATMLGSTESGAGAGIMSCAIAWLYQLLARRKVEFGIRFSVRVSAVELVGPDEEFHDLLADTAKTCESEPNDISPGQAPRQSQSVEQKLKWKPGQNVPNLSVGERMNAAIRQQSELRASSAEKAAHLIDLAMANRSSPGQTVGTGLSHLFITFHVYQCRVEQETSQNNGKGTCLHLLDLGHGRYSHPNHVSVDSTSPLEARSSSISLGDKHHSNSNRSQQEVNKQQFDNSTTKSLSLSGMANVILALLTGQRQLPFRDSALTHLLREAMSGTKLQPCILAHVSAGSQYYAETLRVLQLTSKMGKLRRRRVGSTSSTVIQDFPASKTFSPHNSGSSSVESSTSNRMDRSRFRGPRMGRSSYARSIGSISSELDCTSGSEISFDTVIYRGDLLSRLGPRGVADGSVNAKRRTSNSDGSIGGSSDGDVSALGLNLQATKDLSPSRCGVPSFRPVKRMMPRTNATFWPRSVSVRRARQIVLNSGEETWVDGPKAMMTDSTTVDANTSSVKPGLGSFSIQCRTDSKLDNHVVDDENGGLQKLPKSSINVDFTSNERIRSRTPPSARSVVTVDGNCQVESNISCSDVSQLHFSASSVTQAVAETTVKEAKLSDLDLGSTSESACSTLELDGKQRSQRALSDISERTEDTETTATTEETNAPKANLNSMAHLSLSVCDLLTPESFPGCHFSLPMPLIPTQSIELLNDTEKAIHELKRQIWGSSEALNNQKCCDTRIDMALSGTEVETRSQSNLPEASELDRSPEPVEESKPSDFLADENRTQNDTLASKSRKKSMSSKPTRNRLSRSAQNYNTSNLHHGIVSAITKDKDAIVKDGHAPIHGVFQETLNTRCGHPCNSDALLRVAAWVDSITVPNPDDQASQARGTGSDRHAVLASRNESSASNFNRKMKQENGFSPMKQFQMEREDLYRQPGLSGGQDTPNCFQPHSRYPPQAPSPSLQSGIGSGVNAQWVRSGDPRTSHFVSTDFYQQKYCYSPGTKHEEQNHIRSFTPRHKMIDQHLTSQMQTVIDSPFHSCTPVSILSAGINDAPPGPKLVPFSRTCESQHVQSCNTDSTMDWPTSPTDVPNGEDVDVDGRKKKPSFRGLRFLTLPLFRNLILRYRESCKIKQRRRNFSGDELISSSSTTVKPIPNFFCHRASTPSPRQLRSNQIAYEATRFKEFDLYRTTAAGSLKAASTNRKPRYSVDYRQPLSVSPVPDWCPSLCTEIHDGLMCERITSAQRQPTSSCSTSISQDYGFPTPLGLPSSPSVPLNALCPTSGMLLSSFYRSGRRSVTGGPASSGYESMRIGTSDLSLSHQDSNSECSALPQPQVVTRDALKSFGSPIDQSHRPRRCSTSCLHSNVSRASKMNPCTKHLEPLLLKPTTGNHVALQSSVPAPP